MSSNNGESEFIRGELRQLRQDHVTLGKMFDEHKEARTEDNKALIVAIHSLTATCADLSGYIRSFNIKLDSGLVMYQRFSLAALGIVGAVFLGKEAISTLKAWLVP
jgi:hypothetical protein